METTLAFSVFLMPATKCTRMNECFKSRLPSMKDRDITAEGLLGCTYDEYDRYRYLCKWPIWRV